MGYYSNLDLDLKERADRATQFEEMMYYLDRLQELEDRLEFFEKTGTGRGNNYILEEELPYVLPEHIDTIQGIEKAMEILRSEITDNFEILIRSDSSRDEDDTVAA